MHFFRAPTRGGMRCVIGIDAEYGRIVWKAVNIRVGRELLIAYSLAHYSCVMKGDSEKEGYSLP
jgi:hypothetical protein